MRLHSSSLARFPKLQAAKFSDMIRAGNSWTARSMQSPIGGPLLLKRSRAGVVDFAVERGSHQFMVDVAGGRETWRFFERCVYGPAARSIWSRLLNGCRTCTLHRDETRRYIADGQLPARDERRPTQHPHPFAFERTPQNHSFRCRP